MLSWPRRSAIAVALNPISIRSETCINDSIEVTIELIIIDCSRSLCNLLVVVNIFFEIKVILAVLIVVLYELARNGSHDIFQNDLNDALKSLRTLIRHAIKEQAKIITEVLCC